MISILHPLVLYLGLPFLGLIAYWRWVYYKDPVYLFSSLLPLKNRVYEGRWRKVIPFILRCCTLLLLVLALARPRIPDIRTKIPVHGVDIVLVLDISDSMSAFDDRSDNRTRLDIAKQEAISFIQKRAYDPVGLVLFSQVAVSRCPLTLDKKMLEEILTQVTTEALPADGTVLADGIITAANRLKKSKARSRIMIVLTDGVPTPNDSDPSVALTLAKKLGIKIYTIGIGSEEGGWRLNGLFGWHQVPGQYNEKLLQWLAKETGGQFFRARNQQEMASIYETIDELEKSSFDAPVYGRYFEYFSLLLWAAFFLLLTELTLTTIIWVSL